MLQRAFIILVLTTIMAFSQTPPDNAGIFATTIVPPLKPLLSSLAPGAKISESRQGDMTVFSCEWPDVTVTLTMNPRWDGRVQCSGMKGWISKFPAGDTNTPAVASLLHKIDSTIDCVGSVITPRYDSDGKAASLVLGLATKFDGYVYSYQSFYDTTGSKIIGVVGNPTKLKTQKQ